MGRNQGQLTIMGKAFEILDYKTGTIHQHQSMTETLMRCEALMTEAPASFDILCKNTGRIVTCDFIEDAESKEWKYSPVIKNK